MLAADNVPEPEARKQVILTAPFFSWSTRKGPESIHNGCAAGSGKKRIRTAAGIRADFLKTIR